MTIVEETKMKMKAAIDYFKNELRGLRTGGANPGLVEHVLVEVYDTDMRLRDIATITSNTANREIIITPYDAKHVSLVNKAIEKANLGFNSYADGSIVRVKVPAMTDEIRKKMIKLCHEMKEKAKVSLRELRRKANEQIKSEKTAMGEDLVKKTEEKIQQLTDDSCKEVDNYAKEKEKELLTI